MVLSARINKTHQLTETPEQSFHGKYMIPLEVAASSSACSRSLLAAGSEFSLVVNVETLHQQVHLVRSKLRHGAKENDLILTLKQ